MTVTAFQSKVLQSDGPWRPAELKALVESLAPGRPAPERGAGMSESPKRRSAIHLLGAPDDECILCISRLGRVYVLEDGAGKLLFETTACWRSPSRRGQCCRKRRRRSLRARRSSGARFGKPLKKSWMQWCWKATNCWCTARPACGLGIVRCFVRSQSLRPRSISPGTPAAPDPLCGLKNKRASCARRSE